MGAPKRIAHTVLNAGKGATAQKINVSALRMIDNKTKKRPVSGRSFLLVARHGITT